MPRPVNPGERHTYNGWLRIGYQVTEGQHMVGRNENGIAVFDSSQVLALPEPAPPERPPRRVPRGEFAEYLRTVRRQGAQVQPDPVLAQENLRRAQEEAAMRAMEIRAVDWSDEVTLSRTPPPTTGRFRVRIEDEVEAAPRAARPTVDYEGDPEFPERIVQRITYPSGHVLLQYAPHMHAAMRMRVPPDPSLAKPQGKRKVHEYAPQDVEPTGFAKFVKRIERKEK